jgi:hypothetical protein
VPAGPAMPGIAVRFVSLCPVQAGQKMQSGASERLCVCAVLHFQFLRIIIQYYPSTQVQNL